MMLATSVFLLLSAVKCCRACYLAGWHTSLGCIQPALTVGVHNMGSFPHTSVSQFSGLSWGVFQLKPPALECTVEGANRR